MNRKLEREEKVRKENRKLKKIESWKENRMLKRIEWKENRNWERE